MNRILEGDFGSSKTIIFMINIYILYLNNYQSVLMAPTKALTKQH